MFSVRSLLGSLDMCRWSVCAITSKLTEQRLTCGFDSCGRRIDVPECILNVNCVSLAATARRRHIQTGIHKTRVWRTDLGVGQDVVHQFLWTGKTNQAIPRVYL